MTTAVQARLEQRRVRQQLTSVTDRATAELLGPSAKAVAAFNAERDALWWLAENAETPHLRSFCRNLLTATEANMLRRTATPDEIEDACYGFTSDAEDMSADLLRANDYLREAW